MNIYNKKFENKDVTMQYDISARINGVSETLEMLIERNQDGEIPEDGVYIYDSTIGWTNNHMLSEVYGENKEILNAIRIVLQDFAYNNGESQTLYDMNVGDSAVYAYDHVLPTEIEIPDVVDVKVKLCSIDIA